MNRTIRDWLRHRYTAQVARYVLINHWQILRTKAGLRTADGGAYGSTGSPAEAARRAILLAHEFQQRLGHAFRQPPGLVVEIGPGDSIAMLLLWIGRGTRLVCGVEAFADARNMQHEKRIAEHLLRSIPSRQRDRILKAVDLSGPELQVDPTRIQFIANSPAERLDQILPAGSANLILSNAVLEHVADLKNALRAMHLCLAPDGLMIHRVDLRNHGVLAELGEWAFLRPSERLWRAMGSSIGLPNRHGINFYENLLNSYGYTVEIEPTWKPNQSRSECYEPAARDAANGFWLSAIRRTEIEVCLSRQQSRNSLPSEAITN